MPTNDVLWCSQYSDTCHGFAWDAFDGIVSHMVWSFMVSLYNEIYDMVWYGMVWYVMVWYEAVLYSQLMLYMLKYDTVCCCMLW